MHCPNCGTETTADDRFCPTCGTALGVAPPTGPPPAPPPPPPPPPPPDTGGWSAGPGQGYPPPSYPAPPPGYPGAAPGAGPSGPRADFGTRFLAALLDGVILVAADIVLGVVLKGFGSFLAFVGGIAYYVYLEGSPSGQTIGKHLMKIRVIDYQTGGPLGYSKAAVRYLGRIVSTLICLIGYLMVLWDREKQALHDKIAGTVVVPVEYYPVAAWPG
jgi:uncharacterized RDD family membrane protein YckC